MRPRLHGRGERRCRCEPRSGRRGFNAATATWPWRTKKDLDRTWQGLKLQFGHGYMAVENDALGQLGQGLLAASMRPRLHGRGELVSLTGQPSPPRSLQCGHGYMAVENLYLLTSYNGGGKLQCGHGYMAVENSPTGCSSPRSGSGFNAATATWPWRTRTFTLQQGRGAKLQCGHGYMAVENACRGFDPRPRYCSFNAATATWPWRTTGATPSTFGRPTSFNAATATWPWRTRSTGGSGRAYRCFNAATATWPWRTRTAAAWPDCP